MSNIAIRVENLSKEYHLGRAQERHDTLRDALAASFKRLRRRPSQRANQEDILWALKDVSFEVQRGEVVGIIGRNGAGKSTLLKILSQITEPTRGRAEIHGRVGSLLEVGTGFHPELTGRENIYLNGAILGMRRAEIDRRFDEIVAFAEIERFLDTPVKRYSSGMYVRLAFAVAAHLEPEILLVDEVLAVGDAQFQKKCLGKMGEVAEQGRTVLFISHNMGAVAQLCPTSVYMQSGRMVGLDRSPIVIREYLSGGQATNTSVYFDPASNLNRAVTITACWIANSDGEHIATVSVSDGFKIGLDVLVRRSMSDLETSLRISTALGQSLFTCNLSDSIETVELATGKHRLFVEIPKHFLAPGLYSLTVAIHKPNIEILDIHENILSFQIEESGSRMWQYHGMDYGSILTDFQWQLLRVDSK